VKSRLLDIKGTVGGAEEAVRAELGIEPWQDDESRKELFEEREIEDLRCRTGKTSQVEGGNNMKTRTFFVIAFILTLACLSMPVVDFDGMFAGDRQDQRVQEKFEHYRQAIKEAFQVDIKDFKDSLKGGLADGKSVTEYDLEQLLMGIKFEMAHTRDSLIALEIAMDHLRGFRIIIRDLQAGERAMSDASTM
jgi:hypothetical protein